MRSLHADGRGDKLINPINFCRAPGNLLREQHLSTELCTAFVDNLELQKLRTPQKNCERVLAPSSRVVENDAPQ
jgi:hypothetical protein